MKKRMIINSIKNSENSTPNFTSIAFTKIGNENNSLTTPIISQN